MLIDTNIIMEIALRQKYFETCRDLLDIIKTGTVEENVYITRFTLSALEALLGEKCPGLLKNILLLILEEKIQIVPSDIGDDLLVNSTRKNLALDFDDAIQFVAANKMGTYLVTLDNDFKGTGLQIKTPKQALNSLVNS